MASRRASDFFATVVRRIEICMKGLIDSGVQVICDFGIRISDFGFRNAEKILSSQCQHGSCLGRQKESLLLF